MDNMSCDHNHTWSCRKWKSHECFLFINLHEILDIDAKITYCVTLMSTNHKYSSGSVKPFALQIFCNKLTLIQRNFSFLEENRKIWYKGFNRSPYGEKALWLTWYYHIYHKLLRCSYVHVFVPPCRLKLIMPALLELDTHKPSGQVSQLPIFL